MEKRKKKKSIKDALFTMLIFSNIIFIILLFRSNAEAKSESEQKKESFEMNVEFISGFPTGKPNVPDSETELEKMTVIATAYCACEKCCGKTDGITATGTKATAGRTVAVDTRMIPYGSKIYIDGHEYIAEDCGGAIKDNRIDIYFDTHDEALQFGRKTLEIEIERA